MTKDQRVKLFSAAVFCALSLGFFFNSFHSELENYLVIYNLDKNQPKILPASLLLAMQKPAGPPKPENCEISAESALAIAINQQGKTQEIIFEKAGLEQMPIASITKLMSAIIVDEFYQDGYTITISPKAIEQEELLGSLKAGEKLTSQDLLKIMLIESSNDAAFALSEPMGGAGFVDLMNLKAQDIGLANSFFYNSTGLDQKNKTNYSTAWDLVSLAQYLLQKLDILQALSTSEFDLYLDNGTLHHTLKNTNELLLEDYEIVAGKTGYTRQAGQCLFLISKIEGSDDLQISIVLNSKDRFSDMRKLLTCASFKE